MGDKQNRQNTHVYAAHKMRNINIFLFAVTMKICGTKSQQRQTVQLAALAQLTSHPQQGHGHHHHHRTFMMRLLQKGHRCITESTLSKINE